jgi:N-acetylneuraminate lyase
MSKFTGAWPALVTPFTETNQVNIPVLKELAEYLIQKRAAGFYLCGATGQGLSMSVVERKRVLEAVLEQVSGRIPIITQVGCLSVPEAADLAQHAREVGADAISSIIPPGYRNQESLFAYFATVAGAAPDLPFMAYILAPNVDTVAFMRELLNIPNMAGIKYTGPDMYQLRQIVQLRNDDWTVFSGMDEQSVFAAMWGANGNIGSTLNVMPGLYGEIQRLIQKGDLDQAQTLQFQANQVTETLHAFDFPGALRAAVGFLGFACGSPRLPALPLPAGEQEALREGLEAANFFEVVAM